MSEIKKKKNCSNRIENRNGIKEGQTLILVNFVRYCKTPYIILWISGQPSAKKLMLLFVRKIKNKYA